MNTSDGLLNELDRLSKQPATLLNREYWFPLALFGALSIGGALVFWKWDPADTASWVWWAVLGPLGGVATSAWFRSRSVAIGVVTTAPPVVYVTLGGLCAVGCAIAGSLVPVHGRTPP